MFLIVKKIFVSFFAIVLCSKSFAQQKQLSDDQYFKGNLKSIVQPLPNVTRWVDNNHFQMMKDGKLYTVDASNGKEREAVAADVNNTVPLTFKPYVKDNDIFIKETDVEIRLTNDKEKESNPTLSADGNFIAYTKNNDLYTLDMHSKKVTRLTNDGSEVILNGYSSWVYMEEILGRATQYKAFWWSPDSKHLAYFRSDDTNVPVFTITDGNGQHGLVEQERYPKVGDPNPSVKVGVVSATGGSTVWADFNEKDDQYFGMPYWKPDGSSLLVQWMNRKQDNLKIWEVNISNGSKKIFYNEQQKTWVDLDDNDRISFLKNGKGFLLLSDETGWRHIYNYDITGRLINAVTSGKFTVSELNYIDDKKAVVYFTARKENSARKDLYKVGLNGKNLKRLTFGDYNHLIINISPDASYFITSYSNVYTPTKLALLNTNGKLIKELGDSKTAEFSNYQLSKTELVRVKTEDGLYDLPLKITWPLNMDKNKKYPVLISVYGGPSSTGVMDSWTLTGNQQWFAKEGLIQVSMDHRASGHFGKAGVDNMYHNLGYWEMKDYTTMVKWLIANGNANPSKVCITGFSYGGYLSAYALTYGSDIFTHGMAGGTVADWSLYDTHYAERFMGTLEDNAEGYKKSAVLTYTSKYKGMLQIVHGVIDDNVHMQNSLQLISKLQDEKKDFEFMLYSGGRHGWGGLPAKSAHFQNLKTKFIYKYLLEKEVPSGILK